MPPELKLGTPRVLRAMQWRRVEAHVEIFDIGRQAWFKYHAWTAPVLEGIEQGLAFDALATRIPKRDAEKMLRRFLFELRQAGNLDLGLPEPPRAFGGRYEVERELGRGAVGVAWRCLDAKTGERVVVKQPWAYFTGLADAERFLRREADVLRALDDARIVRLLDEVEGCLVRSFVDGRPLPLGKPGWEPLAAEIADIIASMHQQGFLLLDGHPGNFLVTAQGPLLIDAGFATRVGENGVARVERAYAGQGFVAPEVRLRKEADARADVWGVGRLCYALKTGILPQEWTEAQLAERAPGDIIMALCREEPTRRPRTAMEAARLIRRQSSA